MPSKATAPSGLGAYTPSDLAGLTVPQLKALCKEKKIPGYSKLGKQALIRKLSGIGSSTPAVSASNALVVSRASSPTVAAPLRPPDGPSASASRKRQKSNSAGKKDRQPPNIATPFAAIVISTSQVTTQLPKSQNVISSLLAPPGRPSVVDNCSASVTRVAENSGKRGPPQSAASGATSPASNSESLSGLPDRIPVQHRSRVSPILKSPLPVSDDCSALNAVGAPSQRPPRNNKRLRQNAEAMPPPSSKRPRLLPLASTPEGPSDHTVASFVPALAPSKRFKPLVVDKSKLQCPLVRLPAQLAMSGAPATGDLSVSSSSEAPLADLELDCFTSVPELFPITMPPTLFQRKRVHRWAVILSGLSNAERAICVLVSRAFRYAVYLSASSILTRDYAGRRLQEDVLCKYSHAMTNMWPYLRLREAEVARRRRIYEASFVSRFFQSLGLPNPIETRLWVSPDNHRQLSVAVRFALTRAWFELSLGSPCDSRSNPDSWLNGTIVDVQEVVPTEIWSVTIEYTASLNRARKLETLYVLEATCEVIGRPIAARSDSEATGHPLRVDWSTYIAHRLATKGSTEDKLLSRLKWACQEDYDQGISTLWLERIAAEGQTGTAKRTVAERYVMASVVGNSISGQWMTTSEMAQEFAGLPARVAAARLGGQKNATLNLFLPEHHHVESVHFTATGGKDLHPALAVVQTPHREYYVLRDNGMQVGCEEDGVAEVWREVLRCDTRGRALSS